MDSPLIIIAELLWGVISGTWNTVVFILEKLYELALSLLFFSTLGIFGFLVAIVIGVVVFVLITKFILKNSSTLLSVGLSFAVVIGVLVALSLI